MRRLLGSVLCASLLFAGRSAEGVTVTAPVSRPEATPAGNGIRQGPWHTLGVPDGFAFPTVLDIAQDASGHLWFAARDGAVRYDGGSLILFTAADGLGEGWVLAVEADRAGNLWFGTQGGVVRYDGESFVTFTTADGLAHDRVGAILEDRQGRMWFGTGDHWSHEGGGVSRYDGESFVTIDTGDGLAHDEVLSIFEDRHGTLWFGTKEGVSRYDGVHVRSLSTADGMPDDWVNDIAQDRHGNLWFATGSPDSATAGGAVRYDGETFASLTAADGLASDWVMSVTADADGDVWFGTQGGVTHYRDRLLTIFNRESGLGNDWVLAMFEDRDGSLWMGTWGGGVSRYEGKEFAVYSTSDGLLDNRVYALHEDRQGAMWIGTYGGGVARLEGDSLTVLTEADGLGGSCVWSIGEDASGDLWFGTLRGGVTRYDGRDLTVYGAAHGLPSSWVADVLLDGDSNLWLATGHESRTQGFGGLHRFTDGRFLALDEAAGPHRHNVWSVLEDRAGDLWLGTEGGGVARYDGQAFTWFTTADGLIHDEVTHLLEDRRGHLWIGTKGGLSRFDGAAFTSYSVADGLAHHMVTALMEDESGVLWIGTTGGLSRYDGLVFQSLTSRDGLAHDLVHALYESRDGDVWIGTDGGLNRLRPRSSPPGISISTVMGDRASVVPEEVELTTSQEFVSIGFSGTSLKTPPNQLAYVHRLIGQDSTWRVSRGTTVTFTDLGPGQYEFQVRAVDRDLNYSSQAASVGLVVRPPYDRILLTVALVLSLSGLTVTTVLAVRRRRERDQARMAELEKELQTAHDMQMGLMPTDHPAVGDLDVSGRCVPASQVCGDLFQYFPREEGLTIAVADVTGHAMQAAIPVVMFSGMLGNQMETPRPLDEMLQSLNRSLCRSLDRHTFICLCVVQINATGRLRITDCGCPHPVHYHAATGTVSAWQIDAYPLGVSTSSTYQVREGELEPGDYLVLYSDGFPETSDDAGAVFGYARTFEEIRVGCDEGLDADGLIDRLQAAVEGYSGRKTPADDMTCVVVRRAEVLEAPPV